MKEVQVINPKLSKKTDDILRVAAYCRVSTDSDDQMNSFIAQVKYYNDFISRNKNMVLVDIYADEGITGTCAEKRDEFLRMIADAKKGKIDRILVKSVSRFARNALECIENIRLLKSYGTTVLFENDNIDTETMNSEMILYVKSAFAQSEAMAGSKRVSTAVRMRMERGEFKTTTAPYGYDLIDGNLVPNEEQLPIVQRIFKEYLSGNGMTKVAEIINEEEQTDRVWDKTAVQYVLKNEKYIGDMLMQKTYSVDCISKKTKKNNGELPKYLISNNHTPIVSREVFKLVQAETAKRNSKRKKSNQGTTELGKYNSKYALSDVLICGECGSSYRRNVKYDNGRKKVYWRCINRIENGTKFCSKSSGIREEKLHAAICRALSKISPSKEDIYNAMKASLEYGITEDDTSLNIYNIKYQLIHIQLNLYM